MGDWPPGDVGFAPAPFFLLPPNEIPKLLSSPLFPLALTGAPPGCIAGGDVGPFCAKFGGGPGVAACMGGWPPPWLLTMLATVLSTTLRRLLMVLGSLYSHMSFGPAVCSVCTVNTKQLFPSSAHCSMRANPNLPSGPLFPCRLSPDGETSTHTSAACLPCLSRMCVLKR